ncbi:MAG: threonine/serine dehydratase [Blastocatellia bacterium]
MNIHAEAVRAEARIRPYLRETPLDHSLPLSGQAEVFVKLENLQYTGSFKARGAMNKLLALTPEQQQRGIVTASTGNHGAAVAFGLRTLGLPGLVFVPENASATKVEAIRRYGAEVCHYSTNPLETELYARRYAEEKNLVYISPYNDPDVIAGQGTIGVELARQLPQVDAVFIAVGGGGLAAGVAGYLKAALPRNITVIGCLPENSPEMAVSVRAGHFVEMVPQPTLSDGTAGGFEPGAITFDLCRTLIDDYVLVSEAGIAAAMRQFMEAHHMLIEGAAGAALAGYARLQDQFRHQNVVIIICGANISLSTLKSIL